MDFNYQFYFKENKIFLSCSNHYDDAEMAIYLYCNNEKIDVVWYKKEYTYQYEIDNNLMDNDFHAAIFIRVGSKIYSKKTTSLNPYKLTEKIKLVDCRYLNSLNNIVDIENKINELKEKYDFNLHQILENLLINDYGIYNKDVIDYIFIRYVLCELNLPGNWVNSPVSLGILNTKAIEKIIKLRDSLYRENKITDFTKSFISGIFYIYENDYEKAFMSFRKNDIPSNYYFKVYFKGLLTYFDKISNNKNFPYEVVNKFISVSKKNTFVFSCNKIYYDKFFDKALKSIIDNYGDVSIAIALVNFTDLEISLFEDKKSYIEKKYGIDISYLILKTDKHEKTLSACSRFIMAHEVLIREATNVLVLDLDIYFTKKSNELFKDIITENKISLSLKTNCQRLIPWVAVAAGANYFPDKNSSRFFLEMLLIILTMLITMNIIGILIRMLYFMLF